MVRISKNNKSVIPVISAALVLVVGVVPVGLMVTAVGGFGHLGTRSVAGTFLLFGVEDLASARDVREYASVQTPAVGGYL